MDSESGDAELGETEPFAEAERWCDWLQPILLEDAELLTRALRSGEAIGGIGEANYAVRTPPRPTEWRSEEGIDESMPTITIKQPPEQEPAVRVAATTLVNEVSDHTGDNQHYEQTIESDGLSPTTFGTVAHRLSELRPPRDEWEAFIRRVSRMVGEDPSQKDLSKAIEHAEDAIRFVEEVESEVDPQQTFDEYSVVARLDETRIVGDIDRLLVSSDAYHIIDYKTNDLSTTTASELADHYRPQMLSYALALLQHDPNRHVQASLRFTDEGIQECFEWEPNQRPVIEAELVSMVNQLV